MQKFRPQAIANPALLRSRNALAAGFIIVFAEAQRNWLDATGMACLATSSLLLITWLGHLSKHGLAVKYAALAIDFSLASLLALSAIYRFSGLSEEAGTIARMLAFWSPLIAAWWGCRFHARPISLWALLMIFWAVLVIQLAAEFPHLHDYLILSALIALLVRHIPSTLENHRQAGAMINLRDSLTGLSSPEQFEAELAHLSAIADRYRLPLCLLGCRFQKQETHDPRRHGELLHQYANAIADRLRTSDTCCAWDQETFVILLPNTTATQADALAAELAKILERTDACQHIESAKRFSSVEHCFGNDPMFTFSRLEKNLSEKTSTQDCG